MNAAVRFAVLSGLCAWATACVDREAPTAPSVMTPAPTYQSLFVPSFPSVSTPARIYVHVDSLSRYVLYDDGTFVLQYSLPSYPFFEYRGAYIETHGVLAFSFGSGFGGERGASGSIAEDSLTVNYGVIMQHSDFYDGVYRLEK